MAQEAILTVDKLAKRFGGKVVLRDVTFTVYKGEIVGFIGRNGSGKTTTIKSILGLIEKNAGEVTIGGEKVRFGDTTATRQVGYLPDVPEFYNYMRPEEYMRLNAKVAGVPDAEITARTAELLKLVGLETRKKIGTFSRGMKQRLGIAQALIGRPKLLICDEPTSALDPMGRYDLLEILQRIKHETTIVFSTHILSDVERISDRIVLLDEGVVKYAGSVDALKQQYATNAVRIEVSKKTQASMLAKQFKDAVVAQGEREVVIRCADLEADYPKLLQAVEKAAIIPVKIELVEPDLEQLFMEIAS